MKWMIVVLFLNISPGVHEIHSQDYADVKECRALAKELNEKMDYMNQEATRLGKLQTEQVYAWCERK